MLKYEKKKIYMYTLFMYCMCSCESLSACFYIYNSECRKRVFKQLCNYYNHNFPRECVFAITEYHNVCLYHLKFKTLIIQQISVAT